MKKEKIEIICDNGEKMNAEVIAYFTLKYNNKNYILYTQNKEDRKGNVEVYISEVIKKEEGMCVVAGIDDEKAWEEIEKVLEDLASN